MKLATVAFLGRPCLVAPTERGFVDLTSALAERPVDVAALFAGVDDPLAVAGRAAANAERLLDDPRPSAWRSPVLSPRKILGVGGNFRSHIVEAAHLGARTPVHPVWFNKQATSACGPYDAILRPPDSEQLDYEGELGVVIGRPTRRIGVEDALGCIAGYVVGNDVSLRDWQLRAPTATAGKSYDTHAPFGPWLVTPDEVGDPQDLGIRTWVNGELRQDGSTAEMIFGIAELIADASRMCTLEVGDVLFTGSPSGVGGLRTPPVWLRDGDVVRVEIDRVGAIENTVRDEVLPR